MLAIAYLLWLICVMSLDNLIMFDITENENEKIYRLNEPDILKNIRLFEEEIENFIKNDNRNLVLDMSLLGQIDSMFLSVILKFRTKLSLGGRTITIINYSEHVYKCFQLLHLDDYLLG